MKITNVKVGEEYAHNRGSFDTYNSYLTADRFRVTGFGTLVQGHGYSRKEVRAVVGDWIAADGTVRSSGGKVPARHLHRTWAEHAEAVERRREHEKSVQRAKNQAAIIQFKRLRLIDAALRIADPDLPEQEVTLNEYRNERPILVTRAGWEVLRYAEDDPRYRRGHYIRTVLRGGTTGFNTLDVLALARFVGSDEDLIGEEVD